ncbi:MAG: YlxR family protein [Actinomycetota bacterium]|nr:YlxR family protein [Actinomycetota bacterium]
MTKKKVPLRTCIGCGEVKPKKELLRIVRTPNREINFDPTGKASGRGAYMCPKKGCLDLAVKKKRFSVALEVPESEKEVEKLAVALSEHFSPKADAR